MFIVSPSFLLPPSSSASPVHRVCIGLHHTLQTHVFGLRELVFSDGLTSDVCVLVGRALVEPLLLDAAAGVLANVDLTHLFSGLVRYTTGVGVRVETVAVGCRMLSVYWSRKRSKDAASVVWKAIPWVSSIPELLLAISMVD
jgi:hypothetical protein